MTEATANAVAAPIADAGAVLTNAHSIRDTVLAQFRAAEPAIQALADKYRGVAYDVTTTKGMREAVAARADLRDNGRFLLTKTETRIKGEVNDLKRVMGEEVERLVSIVKPIEEHVDGQIKAEEKRKADEKAAREKAEAERVERHRQNLEKLRSYVTRAEGQPLDAIEKAIEVLEHLELGEAWEEFLEEAKTTRAATVTGLRKLAESERLRLENQRLAEELAKARAAQPPAPAPAPAPAAIPAPGGRKPENPPQSVEVKAPQAIKTEAEIAKPTPTAAPAAPPAPRLGLTELSDDEFKLLISNGGTLTIGQINTRLKCKAMDADLLKTLGMTTRKERGAVHMEEAEFQELCNRFSAHILSVRDSFQTPL